MSRESVVARTMVELAESLVDDFDVVELLTLLADRCVQVFNVAAAGVMLASAGGILQVVASSSSGMHILELFEEQSDEGPCPDCYRTGAPVVNQSLASAVNRWPNFAPRALAGGFQSVHALPMNLRNDTIGALNLFRTDEGPLDEGDVLAAQALADVATIAILQQRAMDAQLVQDAVHPSPQRPDHHRTSQRRPIATANHRHERRIPMASGLRQRARRRPGRRRPTNNRREIVWNPDQPIAARLSRFRASAGAFGQRNGSRVTASATPSSPTWEEMPHASQAVLPAVPTLPRYWDVGRPET